MANVLLENVSKQFPDGAVAVDSVNLQINDREFLVLVGPSGCGKSTTLRLIAGLETITSGEVKIGDCVVTNVAPKDRNIAMVFQNYALYPHMSVYRNMSFGLSLRSGNGIGIFDGGVLTRGLRKLFRSHRAAEHALSRDEIDNMVRQTAVRLGIEKLLDRKPHQLSGGERQRVALGRAIVRKPAAFLLDEPLSNLDANLRQKMRVELKRIHRELQTTMIYVTHDQVEAMTLGDRVAVMNEGKVLQVGKPLEIYQQPASLFVAKFMGNLPINLCRGMVSQTDGRICFTQSDHQLKNDFEIQWAKENLQFEALKKRLKSNDFSLNVVIGFRAEDVRVSHKEKGSDQSGWFPASVTEIERLGDSAVVHVCVDGIECGDNLKNGDLSGRSSSREILVRQPADTNLHVGDRVNLVVEPERVLWFDPESGKNLLKE